MTARDILIVGGGVVGLAIAIELKRQGAKVTVVSQDFTQAASHAAAGMLAPLAEQLSSSPLRDLCLRSRWLYPEWTQKLEELTGIETGYLPCGILAPTYTTYSLPEVIAEDNGTFWLDRAAIKQYQPGLSDRVAGGWWYPEDGQVDNRCLMRSLLQAAQTLGIELKEGVRVKALQQKQGRIDGALTNIGQLTAQQYVLAAGSWSSQLMPMPVRPVKGQMLSLRMPQKLHQPYPLQRVLYGQGVYLVPRQDGRLIVGATVEEVDWTPFNTPQGIQSLLAKTIELYPAAADWQIEEFWWGFRPGTPDELPILGRSACENLFLATGHYRNGILLAPITASLMADLILEQQSDPLLAEFSYQRFHQPANMTLSNPRLPLQIKSTPQAPLSAATTALLDDRTIEDDRPLIIAGRTFKSRLMTGTGKYPSMQAMQESVAASGCEIITVAVRRVQTKAPGHEGLAEAIDWSKIWMLPNTAGCKTAEEAVRVARLGREMAKLLGQEDNNFIKLEVIPDAKYLLPDPIGTLQAAEQLVKEGFAVLPYINADPLLAKRLEEVGCATVMPLGSPIGSGQGINNAANIAIIIEEANVPVVVDAGIGTPSEAALAMEMGADALLVNSAIALAQNPVAMGRAMGLAAVAGRLAYLSGRIPVKQYATASSPLTGTIN
ncbi:MAG: glycine oxidase ThiO [Pleurocapsa sp. SU_5_0]|nr:glycine oxidase ThiO [Pleurocapsa sp. SU_5_0]NJO97544.1 glycine oxidase ThiO [Pleurocapsa sp. CRU_1_2]NJR46808.1 glycine oxidase ThiO [Hyellaceae cyanobacterium CSU_1_1]